MRGMETLRRPGCAQCDHEAFTIRRPSGDREASFTSLAWPSSVPASRSDCRSRTASSALVLTSIRFPSGEKVSLIALETERPMFRRFPFVVSPIAIVPLFRTSASTRPSGDKSLMSSGSLSAWKVRKRLHDSSPGSQSSYRREIPAACGGPGIAAI